MGRENRKNLYGNKFVNIREGVLFLDGINPLNLVKQYGTPLYIFCKQKIRNNIKEINECFSNVFHNSQGFYSLKSNYLLPVLNEVKSLNFGVEIVGQFELDLLSSIQFNPSYIIGGGPYLSNSFLQALLDYKVKYLVVYHLEDIPRIQKALEKNKIFNQAILIRFRAPKYTARHGIPVEDYFFDKLKSYLDKAPNLCFKGILSHMGTRMRALVNFQQNIEHIINISKKLTNVGLNMEIIDIGGGFPNADSLKKPQLLEILNNVKDQLAKAGLDNYSLFYEPGRFIVGDSGFCVGKVYHIENNENTIFLDVGNNLIPKFMKSALRFYNLSRITDNPNTPYDFMGNIPSDQDILVKKYNFTPKVSNSDKILIANIGAYALTWSTRFPYKFPKIFFIDGNKVEQYSLNH